MFLAFKKAVFHNLANFLRYFSSTNRTCGQVAAASRQQPLKLNQMFSSFPDFVEDKLIL